ncbi:MAG: site-specific integrase [Pseudonocardia sp.]|nr:site-specific integrase [Pseudonocardia sp.]
MLRLPIPVGSFGTISRARLKDGTWTARTYVRDLDGERRLVSRRGPSGAAAERELKKALAERTAPTQTALGPTTHIRDVAERWYRDVQADVDAGEKSPNTARLYRHYLDRHVLPGVGALRLGDATVARLDDFVSAVGTRSGSGAAKACRSVLSGVMGYAARYGAIPTNPVRDIGRVRKTRHPVKARSLTIAECARWLAQLEADRIAVRRDLPDLTRWFLATGVRIGEAIAVDWNAIDMDRATVEIDHKILRVRGAGLLRACRTKSDAGHRTLPLPLFAVRMLERRKIGTTGDRPLFPDAIGGWRDPSNLSRELREARGSGEFAWVTSHVFRKTCATLLDEGDLSARQIADQLGHAKVSMTQDNYLGRRLTSRRTAQTLDRAIGQTLG